jgi:hypothetical protein
MPLRKSAAWVVKWRPVIQINFMAIKPICDKCKTELMELGAILLSPPDEKSKVDKIHLCVSCYNQILEKIENNN